MLGSRRKKDRMGEFILASPEIVAAMIVVGVVGACRLPESIGVYFAWLAALPLLLILGTVVFGLLGGFIGFVLRR